MARKGTRWNKEEVAERLVGYRSDTCILSDGNRTISIVTEVFGGNRNESVTTTTSFRVEYRGEDRSPDNFPSLDMALSAVYDD